MLPRNIHQRHALCHHCPRLMSEAKKKIKYERKDELEEIGQMWNAYISNKKLETLDESRPKRITVCTKLKLLPVFHK